jgi:hypothetical protein
VTANQFTDEEARILKSLASVLLKSTSHGPDLSNELTDDFLDKQSWADKTVKKDPKRWTDDHKPSMVGKRYSEIPSDWHDVNASLCEWKAAKGREEVPVRLNDKGKPWHESDTFDAKICRAWSRRNRGKKLPPEPKSDFADDPLPF